MKYPEIAKRIIILKQKDNNLSLKLIEFDKFQRVIIQKWNNYTLVMLLH